MFDQLTVPLDLLPVREAAEKGELNAMYNLANSLIKEDNSTRLCHDRMLELCDAMLLHPDLKTDKQREGSIYILLSIVMRRGFEEGVYNRKEFLDHSVLWMKMGLRAFVEAPLGDWYFPQISKTVMAIENFINAYRREFMQENESPVI